MSACYTFLFLISAVVIVVQSFPQEISFPDEDYDNRPPQNFMPQPPRPQTTRATRPPRTTRVSQSQTVSTLPPRTSPSVATPATGVTTRIPPRDNANRLVFTVSCPCNFTREYNPVCGTDGQTYGNGGVLMCAQNCGTKVELYLVGACGRNNG